MEDSVKEFRKIDVGNLAPASGTAGQLLLRYTERGKPPQDRRCDRFNLSINYEPLPRLWWIAGTANDVTQIKIRYEELSRVLSLQVNNYLWVIHETHRVRATIPADKSSFRVDFITNIERTDPAGFTYNILRKSYLGVNR